MEVQADVILAHPDTRVDAKDIFEVGHGLAPEVSPAELIREPLRGCPSSKPHLPSIEIDVKTEPL